MGKQPKTVPLQQWRWGDPGSLSHRLHLILGQIEGIVGLLCWQYLWYEKFCFQTHWSIYRDGFLSAEEPYWDHDLVDKLDIPNVTITLQAFVLMQL